MVSPPAAPVTVNSTVSSLHNTVLFAAAVKSRFAMGSLIVIVCETMVDVQFPEVT